jgi:2-iminoacetate synthase ThiH
VTKQEALDLLANHDLVELGIRAYAERQRRHPDGIVTYCMDAPLNNELAVRLVFDPATPSLHELDGLGETEAIVPVCVPGATAAEYLKFLAICRLYLNVSHIEIDADWAGLKVAQLALRFGADDFGNRKPSSKIPEEEVRRVIRDAGFVPKKRDLLYGSLAVS